MARGRNVATAAAVALILIAGIAEAATSAQEAATGIGKLEKYLSGLSRNSPSTSASSRANVEAFLRCFSHSNFAGDELRLHDYTPYFNQYSFDNRARSCCINGIWLLYDGYNYNSAYSDRLRNVYVGWGENYCQRFGSDFAGLASSARFVGPPDGYKYDTLNLYEYDYFSGREDYHYTDNPNIYLNYEVNSAIVTGCKPWTLYDRPDYQGFSVCVWPSNTFKCYPSFYKSRYNLDDWGIVRGVRSARKGCYSNFDIKGDPINAIQPRTVVGTRTATFTKVGPAVTKGRKVGGSKTFGKTVD